MLAWPAVSMLDIDPSLTPSLDIVMFGVASLLVHYMIGYLSYVGMACCVYVGRPKSDSHFPGHSHGRCIVMVGVASLLVHYMTGYILDVL